MLVTRPLSHATRLPPTPRLPSFALACAVVSSTLPLLRLLPPIVDGSTHSLSQLVRPARRTPKLTVETQAPPPSHRPTSKAHDTAALRSTCRTPPLAVWTRRRFRRMLLDMDSIRAFCAIPFQFRRPARHSLASRFVLDFTRPYHRARRLVPHPRHLPVRHRAQHHPFSKNFGGLDIIYDVLRTCRRQYHSNSLLTLPLSAYLPPVEYLSRTPRVCI